jgi:hypothetical protein
LLDRAAVQIAGWKIHREKASAGRQHLINQAHSFEQFCPIDIGDRTQAGNDVADRHRSRALALVFLADNGVGRCTPRGQMLV